MSKIGHWVSGGQSFDNKIDALIYASSNNIDVEYKYFNSTWENYNLDNLGAFTLDELYKQRAIELREKYDYLILYYSGGADSDNILKTFIQNNIKLDAVYVKWPFQVVGSNIYNPNTYDKSPGNFLSEWDFTIKGKLERLAQEHPEIEILQSDWSTKITPKFFNDIKFELANQLRSPGDIARLTEFHNKERELVDAGKKVAAIWGIDKPMLAMDRNDVVGFYFKDAIVQVGYPSDFNYQGLEYFYWSPESPQILFEQAYKVYQFLQANPQYRSLIPSKEWIPLPSHERHIRLQLYFDVIKDVIYSTWDNSFQAGKSFAPQKVDWDNWLFFNNEMSDAIKAWRYIAKSELDYIDERFCIKSIATGEKVAIFPTRTKIFTLGKQF